MATCTAGLGRTTFPSATEPPTPIAATAAFFAADPMLKAVLPALNARPPPRSSLPDVIGEPPRAARIAVETPGRIPFEIFERNQRPAAKTPRMTFPPSLPAPLPMRYFPAS